MADPPANDQPGTFRPPTPTQQLLDEFARVEGQFSQIKEGLSQLQRLSTMGTLTATVIHEVNNLLTPVISYAQLALTKPDDKALSDKAHRKAIEATERVSQLCSTLLGYARDDEDGITSDLRSVIESAIACLGRGLEKDGIELILDVPPIEVAMAASSLEQVLVNIVLNARKAMAEQGGTLTIRAHVNNDHIDLDISDTGPGIPPEVADRLFEPFVTYSTNPQLDEHKGTGLGLSVCRDLITAAGGRITADSQPNQGATFHLTLPRPIPLRQSA